MTSLRILKIMFSVFLRVIIGEVLIKDYSWGNPLSLLFSYCIRLLITWCLFPFISCPLRLWLAWYFPMDTLCLINDQLDMVIYSAIHCKPFRTVLITNAWNFTGLETYSYNLSILKEDRQKELTKPSEMMNSNSKKTDEKQKNINIRGVFSFLKTD